MIVIFELIERSIVSLVSGHMKLLDSPSDFVVCMLIMFDYQLT